ncbi:unnamed protein product [Schistosoma haematobium]|nr:unnamed protein product [Schistosoma haematobium]
MFNIDYLPSISSYTSFKTSCLTDFDVLDYKDITNNVVKHLISVNSLNPHSTTLLLSQNMNSNYQVLSISLVDVNYRRSSPLKPFKVK